MIMEIWEQIKQKENVRQNLSRLRKEIKENGSLIQLLSVLQKEPEYLKELLESEDAKVRKNTALLMGDLGKQENLDPVYEAYERETQRFVKSSYLMALRNFNYSKYLQKLKERLELLYKEEVTEENRKHIMEETRELSFLIMAMEGTAFHRFTGWEKSCDIVLLTNRNFPSLTEEALKLSVPDAVTKQFNAGIMARVNNLRWTGKLRTYQELLFSVKGMNTCPFEPFQAAEEIVRSELLSFLLDRHEGEPPFYFRIELKSKKDPGAKSAFIKKMSGQIEKLSGRTLINSTENYELEIRLIENKTGDLNALVKLFTLGDERFSYRREVMPTSMKPVNAALTAALARNYMKEDAQVLDPFCGVGTMLIERHKAVRANTSYGVDIQEEAIQKARKNTEEAGQTIHYINRDFFRFEHEYLFDEIITDMPFRIGRTTEEEITRIYERFFRTVSRHLKEKAVMILYSHDRELTEKLALINDFCIRERFEISKKEGTYVFVLQEKGM